MAIKNFKEILQKEAKGLILKIEIFLKEEKCLLSLVEV